VSQVSSLLFSLSDRLSELRAGPGPA
jgi:hypothetical protein